MYPMPGVPVMGASGSGTTTLGRAVAHARRWPLLDADEFYRVPTQPPYQQKRDQSERFSMLTDAAPAASGAFVLAGSVVGWGDDVADSCDLIVYLTVATPIRLARLRERELREVGAVDEAFIAWAGEYDEGGLNIRSRALHENWLSCRRPDVLRIEGTPPLDESLRLVLDERARLRRERYRQALHEARSRGRTSPGTCSASVHPALGRHADPRTTMRYDRARHTLDRHPNYILAAFLASAT